MLQCNIQSGTVTLNCTLSLVVTTSAIINISIDRSSPRIKSTISIDLNCAVELFVLLFLGPLDTAEMLAGIGISKSAKSTTCE